MVMFSSKQTQLHTICLDALLTILPTLTNDSESPRGKRWKCKRIPKESINHTNSLGSPNLLAGRAKMLTHEQAHTTVETIGRPSVVLAMDLIISLRITYWYKLAQQQLTHSHDELCAA